LLGLCRLGASIIEWGGPVYYPWVLRDSLLVGRTKRRLRTANQCLERLREMSFYVLAPKAQRGWLRKIKRVLALSLMRTNGPVRSVAAFLVPV
jgi:hypothetical protein